MAALDMSLTIVGRVKLEAAIAFIGMADLLFLQRVNAVQLVETTGWNNEHLERVDQKTAVAEHSEQFGMIRHLRRDDVVVSASRLKLFFLCLHQATALAMKVPAPRVVCFWSK